MEERVPLVLLPGMLLTARLWHRQEPRLRHHARVVHPRVTAASLGAAVEDVLALPYPRFALAGLSLGGIVAMAVAARAPERVERLALLSTNARPPRPEQHAGWRAMAERTRRGEFARITPEQLLPLLLRPAARGDPALSESVVAMAEEVGPDTFLAQLDLQHSRTDARPALPRLPCPTLVVAAADDALCPLELHEEIAGLVPRAQLEVLPDTGHLSPLERPREVTELLETWLTDPAPTRRPPSPDLQPATQGARQ